MARPSSNHRKAPPATGVWRLLDALLANTVGRLFLCALAGTLLFLACADFDIWPLCWLGMVPLLWVLLDEEGVPRVKNPFLCGFVCGLLANGGGFYWIVGLLMRFGHMPFLAALPLFLLLVAYQAITFGLFAVILCRLRAQLDVPVTWLAPLCWTACELCVPYVFPWYLAITQAWVPTVIQIADITGPLGVSFILVLSNAALYDTSIVLHKRRALHLNRRLFSALSSPMLAALVICCSLLYGAVRLYQVDKARAAAPKIKIGVVQANIGIHEKFRPGLREEQHATHIRVSQELERKGADLLVWPESSYPYPLPRPMARDFPDGHPWQVRRGLSKPLIFGALTVERAPDGELVPYNTAVMLDKDGTVVGTFDKNFLLIFGEYLPFARQLAFLRQLVPEISNFARGTTTTTFPLVHDGQRCSLGPMICYEDIIPAFGRRLFADPEPPNLLINITNDAWFGATSEPYEHMALSVFRAVEHRVDLVRAVNTGVSAFIDAAGRVYEKGPSVDPTLTPGVQPTALLADAAILPAGGMYQRLGEAFGSACLVVVLLCGVLARSRSDMPVRWPLLLGGALFLHGLVLLAALILPGHSVQAMYAALLHRSEQAVPEAELFSATWQLLLVLLGGGVILGTSIGRYLGKQPVPASAKGSESSDAGASGERRALGRLEILSAIALTTVLPVVMLGRMEGNTGGVVILSGLGVLGGLLGLRLGRRPRPAK